LIRLACGAFYFFLSESSCLRRIVFHEKSGLRRIFLNEILFLIIRGCISFEVFYSVCQFTSGENDLNSNIESSQQHNL